MTMPRSRQRAAVLGGTASLICLMIFDIGLPQRMRGVAASASRSSDAGGSGIKDKNFLFRPKPGARSESA
jgi:hypothetical protein